MKYYDKSGNIHNTLVGAMVGGIMAKNKEPMTPNMSKTAVEDPDFIIESYTNEIHDESDKPDVALDNAVEEDSTANPITQDPVDEVVEPTAEPPKSDSIFIDYAHNQLVLKGSDGQVKSVSELDPRLRNGTVDKELIAVLYPDGKVPEDVKITTGPSTTKLETSQPVDSVDNTPPIDADYPLG